VVARATALYGTADLVVFEVNPGGQETLLYSFSDGSTYALSGLAMGASGNL
jgi:hypothetical protein